MPFKFCLPGKNRTSRWLFELFPIKSISVNHFFTSLKWKIEPNQFCSFSAFFLSFFLCVHFEPKLFRMKSIASNPWCRILFDIRNGGKISIGILYCSMLLRFWSEFDWAESPHWTKQSLFGSIYFRFSLWLSVDIFCWLKRFDRICAPVWNTVFL